MPILLYCSDTDESHCSLLMAFTANSDELHDHTRTHRRHNIRVLEYNYITYDYAVAERETFLWHIGLHMRLEGETQQENGKLNKKIWLCIRIFYERRGVSVCVHA